MKMDYDVVVIGGGPAGLMSCVGASKQGARVLLIEKGERLGRKLIISGGGRCNVTNNKGIEEFIKNVPGNGRFMYSALHRFGPQEIIQVFEELGVALKEEDNGRMFPVTDKAITVASTLIKYIREQGVEIRLESPVKQVLFQDRRVKGILLQNGEMITCRALIIAAGGRSVPKTGSTGDGYPWAEEGGHQITQFYPTEVPIISDEKWILDRSVQGLSLREVSLTLFNNKNKRITIQEGDMIFTHFGISGPGALRLGHYVSIASLKEQLPLRLDIDIMPGKKEEEISKEVWLLAEQDPKKAIKNVLKGFLPDRLIPLLLENANIPSETTFAHLSKQKIQVLSHNIKHFSMRITGTLPLEEAFVTGGGVSIKEIDPKTMGSKIVDGLYFAGEIMDVHAHTGGYNITIAFSSGYIAGTSAAQFATSP